MTTDTVSLLREARYLINHCLPSVWRCGTKSLQVEISEWLAKIDAAPVAAIQPAGVACSACYGSGYGIDGKPCPCGCRPAASAPAQPEAKGEAVAQDENETILYEQIVGGLTYRGMKKDPVPAWAINVRDEFPPSATVPAAPADKGELQSAASLDAASGSMEDFAAAADLVDLIRGAETNGCGLGAVLGYRRDLLEADRARQAAIAQPSGDWPEDFAGENGQYENSCNRCGTHFIGNKHRRTCKNCAPQPPSTGNEADK